MLYRGNVDYVEYLKYYIKTHPEAKKQVITSIGINAFNEAMKEGNYQVAMEIAKILSKYNPKISEKMKNRAELQTLYNEIMNYVNTMINDMAKGDVNSAYSIYYDKLQALIPEFIEKLRKADFVKDKKDVLNTIYNIQYFIYGLLGATKLAKRIAEAFEKIKNVPKPIASGAGVEGLAKSMLSLGQYYYSVANILNYFLSKPVPPELTVAMNYLYNKNKDLYNILRKAYDYYEKLKNEIPSLHKAGEVYIKLGETFQHIAGLYNILENISRNGFAPYKDELSYVLKQISNDIKTLDSMKNSLYGVYIPTNEGEVSLGDIIDKWESIAKNILQNVVTQLGKTGDYRIYDVLVSSIPKDLGITLPPKPVGYNLPGLPAISNAIHNAMDWIQNYINQQFKEASKEGFNPINMLRMIGLFIGGEVAGFFLPIIDFFVNPSGDIQMIKQLGEGIYDAVFNRDKFLEGLKETINSMFATPGSAALSIGQLIALAIGIKELPKLRYLPDTIRALASRIKRIFYTPVSEIAKAVKVEELEPKLSVAIKANEKEIKALVEGMKPKEKTAFMKLLTKILKGEDISRELKAYIKNKYSGLYEALEHYISNAKAENIEELINAIKEGLKKETSKETSEIRVKSYSELKKITGKLQSKLEALEMDLAKKLEAEALGLEKVIKTKVVTTKKGVMSTASMVTKKEVGPEYRVETTINPKILSGIVYELENIVKELSSQYPKLSETIESILTDIRKGEITSKTIENLRLLYREINGKTTIPKRLYSSLVGLLEKLKKSGKAPEIVNDILYELKQIVPLKDKQVFVFAEAMEGKGVPLITTEDELARARNLFTGRLTYVIEKNGRKIFVERIGEIEGTKARIIYKLRYPDMNKWVKLIIEYDFPKNIRKLFREAEYIPVKVKKILVYDPKEPRAVALARSIIRDIKKPNPDVFKGIDELKKVIVPEGSRDIDAFDLLRRIPLAILPSRPLNIETIRNNLIDLLRQYRVIGIKIGNRIKLIDSVKELDDILNKLKEELGTSQITEEIELESPDEIYREITKPGIEKPIIPTIPIPLPPTIPIIKLTPPSFASLSSLANVLTTGKEREILII